MRKIKSRADFEQELKNAKEGKYALLIDWTATWCGPCQMIHESLKQLEKAYPGLVVVQVDVDDHMKLSDEWKIRSVPTFHWVKRGGGVVKTSVGMLQFPTMQKYAREVLA